MDRGCKRVVESGVTPTCTPMLKRVTPAAMYALSLSASKVPDAHSASISQRCGHDSPTPGARPRTTVFNLAQSGCDVASRA